MFEERFWSAVHTSVFDEAGRVSYVARNAIDVTDLYRFDEATRKYYLRQDANAVPQVPQMSPRAAVVRARAEAPEVWLLDIGRPEMDGNELARRLRALPETARSVLVAVTGYGQENDRQRTLEAGFDHHLVKPLDTKKLFAILEAC